MTEQNALAIYKDFDGLQLAATALYKSGYFSDAKSDARSEAQSEAQAIVKVMAGAELGLPPFASMSGIHIIKGKPTLGSNVMATLVKNDPRYNYKVKKCDNTVCTLTWFENGEDVGESTFTILEANKITTKENGVNIKLSEKATWRFYTSDMLFARAISRGARRYAPGIFGGSPVYTPDEMGADTDEDGYIDTTSVTIEEPKPEPAQSEAELYDIDQPEPTETKPLTSLDLTGLDFKTRPYSPETLKAALFVKAGKFGAYDANEKQRNLLGALMGEYYTGDTEKRHTTQLWLFGAASTKEIDGAMVKAALDWLAVGEDSGGAYKINEVSRVELSSVYDAAIKAEGQDELL